MNRPLSRRLCAVVLAGVTAALIGCSVSDETLNATQQRMDELKAKGVPDSALSGVKVYLFEARDCKARDLGGQARKAADSMLMMLRKVEDYYANHVAKLQPVIDSLLAVADQSRSALSGAQIHKLDSLKGVVDSLAKAQRPVEAEKLARALVARMPALLEDQKKADGLAKIIPGTVWECVNKKTSDVFKEVNAVEKKVFTFGKDGKAVYVESEKGRSDKDTKNDYEFVSYGTYDFAGDTIIVRVNRFIAKRQIIDVRWEKDGKESWKRDVGPMYDSAITDGSQDRWISLADLKEDFTRR